MQRQIYCVYNQTNECFLSLGATLGDGRFARLKQVLGLGPRHVDEGCWISPPEGPQMLGIFSPRDLVYLDASHRVVDVLESFPAFRMIPRRCNAVSLLALPVHTLSSSQTRAGNQLLICAAEEMEWRLRSLPEATAEKQPPIMAPEPANVSCVSGRRGVKRVGSVSAAADCAEGGTLAVQAIRDISATGVYLVTRERWPVGAEVKMSLQPMSGRDEQVAGPVTVRMKVARWGADGVGLEFMGSGAEAAELTPLRVG
ncbi:MAG TPA: PilZ domain-containing protein [Terracidiphilus sp.]|nr:PilZ domain-containing protein [Terracidiphilus sp.]